MEEVMSRVFPNSLCVHNADSIGEMQDELQQMADRLAGLGYADDAARDTLQTLVEVRQARSRIQARLDRLCEVWRAVERWDCNCGSERVVRAAIADYRTEENPGENNPDQ